MKKLWTILGILALLAGIFTVTAAAEADCTVLTANETAMSITEDTCIDLNGYSIDAVTVGDGCTLYVKDSSTDMYSGSCGSIASVSGNGTVCAMDGYMKTTANGAVSFHKVSLDINTVTLSPGVAGLYYKCNFEGDQAVADNVACYGVALSITEIPDDQNVESCPRSKFTVFEAGAGKNSGSSTSLTGILKEANGYMNNLSNSQMEVYGRAYIQTKTGEYIFGDQVSCTLRRAVEAVDASMWTGLNYTQSEQVLSLYRRFTSVMSSWNVDNIKAASTVDTEEPLYDPAAGDDLKLLAITSSFGRNTTDLLYTIAAAEAEAAGIENEITVGRLYGSGCSLEKHVNSYHSGTAVYEYSFISNKADSSPYFANNSDKNKGSTAAGAWSRTADETVTLVEGLQDQAWDIIFIQQGAAQAGRFSAYGTYITQLLEIIKQYQPNAKIVWNMTWAYEEACAAFPDDYKVNGMADQLNMYQYILDATKLYVRSRNDLDAIIPSGTTIQNARALYGNYELVHTDLYHLSNLGKAFGGYTLYAVLTDTDLTEINASALSSYDRSGTYTLTDEDKQNILATVNAALRTPYSVTDLSE